MPIRLIATDLDGTLLNSQSTISEANRQALTAAAEAGIEIVIASGRRFHSALPRIESLAIPLTLITSNGAMIATRSGEVFYRDFLPREVAQEALRHTRSFRPYAVAIFDTPGLGQVTLQEGAVPEGPLGWYLKNSKDCMRLVPELEDVFDTDPIQVMIGGPPTTIDPAEALLRASPAAAKIQLTWTKYLTRNVSLLDVMNRGCSKGRALQHWAEKRGISRREVMALGDNYNDLEMLKFAGFPVLMGNHCDGMDRFGWPRTLPCNDDGLASAIHKLALNGTKG